MGCQTPLSSSVMGIAAFWVAAVSRNNIIYPRYCHFNLLLGPHGLVPLLSCSDQTNIDCSVSVCVCLPRIDPCRAGEPLSRAQAKTAPRGVACSTDTHVIHRCVNFEARERASGIASSFF